MFTSLFSVVALSIIGATAVPTTSPDLARTVAPRSFEVPAIHNTNKVRNGTREIHKAYNKFGLSPTKKMKSLISKRQDGSVKATPASDDSEYLCPVSIGGQDLNLDFDSGSSDLWVFSSSLSSSDKSGHSVYTASKSSTYKKISGASWDISYADGSGASGTVGTDTVTIGGTTVAKQAVELATKISSSFVSDTADGLVGLAFSSINTVEPTQQKTFFDNAKSSLNSPVFTAYLPKDADGSYTFGTITASKHTGSIAYTDVDDSNGFWEYPSTSYKVGSTVHSQSGRTGISDTGTTLVLMGDSAVEAYYKQVDGAEYNEEQEGYVFDCSATLPDLSFKIGDNYATVAGKLMNFGTLEEGSSSCYGSLQSVGSGTQNIYGDVFFNANYGVFDISVPRFGFAPLA